MPVVYQQNQESTKSVTLLHCMGENAEVILNMTGISDEEDQEVYDRVTGRLDAHFNVSPFLRGAHLKKASQLNISLQHCIMQLITVNFVQ